MIDFVGLLRVLVSLFDSLLAFTKPVFDFLSFGVKIPWDGDVISITIQELLFGAGVGLFFAVAIWKWIPLTPD